MQKTTAVQIEGMSSLLSSLLGTLDDRSRPPEPEKPPGSPPVQWKYGKPVFPLIIVKRKPMKDGEKLTELHCGCKCEECINNYKAYWVEKMYSQEVKSAMDSEKELRKEIFKEIKQMELKFEKQLSEMRANWEVADSKRQQLEQALEQERTLRMDETYRREVQNNETAAVSQERSRLETSLFAHQDATIKLRNECDALREAARAALSMKDQALARLRDYERQVNRLEQDNSDVRVRLNANEIEVAKLRHKNEMLKERLGSIRPHEIHEAKMAALAAAESRQAQGQSSGIRRGSRGGGGGTKRRDLTTNLTDISREPRGGASLNLLQPPLGPLASIGSISSMGSIGGGFGAGSLPVGVGQSGMLRTGRALEEPSISALSSITALSGWKPKSGGYL